MEIGTLNQRITFLENRVVTDEIGNHTAVWDEAFSCWAKVTLKSSAEHTDTGVTKETQTLEFLIRQSQHWMPSVTSNRILFRDVTYNITSVTPEYLAAYVTYGGQIPAMVYDGKTLFGAQFHPEKSGETGLQILRNFGGLLK